MTPRPLRRQRGASRLELVIAAILTAVLAGMLLGRITSWQGESERVAAKQLVGTLRTALALRSADALARGGQDALLALAHQNPMDWLVTPPDNYLGAVYSAPKHADAAGNWYFDRKRRTLVYRPASEKSFSPEIQQILVFKVKLIRVPDPVEASGRREVTTGLVLDQMPEQSLAMKNNAVLVPRPQSSEKN